MGIIKKKYLDNVFTGLILGLAGPVFGFLIYGISFISKYEYFTISFYINEIFLNTPEAQAPILTISLVFNALIFYLYLRFDFLMGAKGVVIGTMFYVPVVLYLKFFV